MEASEAPLARPRQPDTACRSALVVRYDEIGLKGGNRSMFERRLLENLRAALRGTPGLELHRIRGRALVRAAVPAEELTAPAARVFGVSSLSPARELGHDLEEIEAAATTLVEELLERRFPGAGEVPFRVTVNRATPRFRRSSMETERLLGARLLERFPRLRVRLKEPALQVELDIRDEGAFLFADRIPGPGGLPVGSLGRALCLLSGGIDSPVAAWLAMKRGVRVEFVSFYSFPYVGPQLKEKLQRLAERLAGWQPVSVLHVVPFTDYQVAIRDHADPRYRTVLYRRAMQRIASRIARRRKAQALVTGESIGQVASQTLENLALIEEASSLPVLRPLVTYDKRETVELARRIGTFEISNLPAPDCCTVFQPERPVIHGRLEEALEAESRLDLQALTEDAVRRTERIRFPESP